MFGRRYSTRLGILVAGLLPALLLLWGGVGSALKTHLADEACAGCHLAQSEVTPENAGKLLASQEVLCTRCHENAVKVSHPSGIHTERSLPASFPLDWKGDLTCSTCHQIHGGDAGLMRVTERGYELCSQCHDEAFFQRMRDGAQSILHSGHLASSLDNGMSLDPFSLKCMECHLKQASTAGLYMTGDVVRHEGGAVNHPIGGLYADASKFGGYKPVNLISDKVMLPDGRMSCISCHSGYSQQHGQVVLDQAVICFECHDL